MCAYLTFLSLFCRNDHKDYMLQSRLHFRIHSAQTEIRAKTKGKKGSTSQNHGEDDDISQIMPPIQNSDTNFAIPLNEDEAMNALVQSR